MSMRAVSHQSRAHGIVATSYRRWAVPAAETPVGYETRVDGRAERGDARRSVHKLLGLLDDVVMLLLVIWLFPLAILLVGAPVALLVRLLIEITKRI